MKQQLLNKLAYSVFLLGGIIFLNSCSKKEFNTSAQTEKYHKLSRELEQYQAKEISFENSEELVAETNVSEDLSADASTEVTPLALTKPVVDLSKPAAKPEKVNADSEAKVKGGKLKQKIAQKVVKKITNSDRVNELDGNLKLALIFVIVGIIVQLIPGIWWVGTVLIVIGLVFLLLWLLNEL